MLTLAFSTTVPKYRLIELLVSFVVQLYHCSLLTKKESEREKRQREKDRGSTAWCL